MNILLSILVVFLATIVIVALGMATIPIVSNKGFSHKRCLSKRKLKGKTALVTGASAGIGMETTRNFAARGARVVMACRNMEKAKVVADDIIRTTKNNDVVIYELNTSSLKSVRKFAEEFRKKESRLDILVNNAGIGGNIKREITEDGFELTMATNHYGHFLLTNLLLDLIKKSSPARIVTVSSVLHHQAQSLDVEDLNFKKGNDFGQLAAYNKSKLCNVLFTYELARKLAGTGVTANCIHPGWVGTEIFGKTNKMILRLFHYINVLVSKTVKSGAQTTIYASVSEETDNMTGKYFNNCMVDKSSKLSHDIKLAKKLWDMNVKEVKLEPREIHY